MSQFLNHRFNDDLLLGQEDQALAARKYPTIFHVLDHPELREQFAAYDGSSNEAKRRGRIFGLTAIGLCFAALAIAALEHFLPHVETSAAFLQRVREWPTILALLAAACGLAGVSIGGIGVLYAERKRQWLYQRLMTERIRQFHFQTFACRLPEILRSLKDADGHESYARSRSIWFDGFRSKLAGKLDSYFTALIDEDDDVDMWLHPDHDELRKLSDTGLLDPLFEAYRELRINHQIGYANYKLSDDRRLLSKEPRGQAAVLSQIGFVSILVVCAVHLLVLLVVLFSPSEWSIFNTVTSTVAILAALAALAARAIEQGLQPEREIERYQQYRSALRAVLERFDQARSPGEKVAAMREMERVSFDEMKNFLVTNDRSRFVM